MWQFCHFLFHPIGWFFWGSAGIGDNLGDGIITNFGDNLCDDFATICFNQYGDFFCRSAGNGENWGDKISPVFGDNPCDRLSGIGRDLSRSGPYFGVRAGCRCSHLDPPANGQAVIYLTGLLEVFISESLNLATVSDNSVRYQAINVVKR